MAITYTQIYSVGPFGASYPIKKTYTVNATCELKLIVLLEIFAWRNFFTNFRPIAFMGKFFYPTNFASCVNDYTEPTVIFAPWAKNYSMKYFSNEG